MTTVQLPQARASASIRALVLAAHEGELCVCMTDAPDHVRWLLDEGVNALTRGEITRDGEPIDAGVVRVTRESIHFASGGAILFRPVRGDSLRGMKPDRILIGGRLGEFVEELELHRARGAMIGAAP